MSERIYYVPNESGQKLYDEKTIEFWYFRGFAASQKMRSIVSMHEEIKKGNKDAWPLEISIYSPEKTGVKLCDNNLKIYVTKMRKYVSVQTIFQASKVFENGGPYTELLSLPPEEAKQDKRLKNSGQVVGYEFKGEMWDPVPTNMFYDYLYLTALGENREFLEQALDYNAYTDIGVNQERAIDCPARAVAIAVGLYRRGLLEKSLESKEAFQQMYKMTGQAEQISLF